MNQRKMGITTAQDLLYELYEIREMYGHLNVPIMIWHDHCRAPIVSLDTFTDGKDNHLHSIDINLPVIEAGIQEDPEVKVFRAMQGGTD